MGQPGQTFQVGPGLLPANRGFQVGSEDLKHCGAVQGLHQGLGVGNVVDHLVTAVQALLDAALWALLRVKAVVKVIDFL
jgi:hypothetical protein